MPGLISVGVLVDVVVVGAGIALALFVVVIAHQSLVDLVELRRARIDRTQRPAVMRAAMTGQLPAALPTTRGRRGRAAERVCYQILPRIRGEAHDRVARILMLRGAERRELRASASHSANTRACAALRLGLIASPGAERRLAELLRADRSREVRIVAARALGDSDSPGAATALLGAVRHDSLEYGDVEVAAGETDPLEVPDGIVASSLLALGTVALPELRELAATPDDGDIARRAMAIDLLGLLKGLTSWRIVAVCLHAGHPAIRLAAARSLGQLGMREPVPALLGCLDPDEMPAIRLTATWALGRIRDPDAAGRLGGCLDDRDHLIAHAAGQALAALGEPGRRRLRHAVEAGQRGAAYAREALAEAGRSNGSRPPVVQPPAASRPWRIGPPIAGPAR